MPDLDNASHERFCQEYIVDLNGGRAYERAGYKARGNAAEVAASRLLRNVQVKARLAELQNERAERVQVTADDVVRGLLTEANGHGPDTVSSSRVSAWEKLGKHLGIFGADGSESNPFHFAFAPIDDEARRRRLAELDEITGPDGTGD